MKKFVSLVLLPFIMITLSSCASEKRVSRQSFAFDTVINITADKKDDAVISGALALCPEFENIFSRTKEGSELYKINNGEITALSDDMRAALEFSAEFSRMTDGAFDFTLAPLTELWNVNKRTVPPTDEEIQNALNMTGYEKFSLEPFDTGETRLDLGGVAKGYIADKLGGYFKEKGVDNVIIDLGGNVLLLGKYSVGIRDPFNPEKLFAKITVEDKSAVTSGAYQRFFEYNGERYHHILDPKTGRCAKSGIASVTVISPSSMHADALSTAIFVLGERALSLCDNFPDTDALIITEEGEVITTDNFAEKYSLQLM